MLSTLVLALCSFVLSYLLTPLLRDLALRRGWVDKPDSNRKLHPTAVPRIGGIPILLAYGGSFAILLLIGMQGSMSVQLPLPLFGKLLPAVLLAFLTGLADDVLGLKPWQKLAGLTTAAILACLAGLKIQGLVFHEVDPVVGVVLTVVWLVGCANAFNLIDGVDGLASGVGLLATITAMVAGLLHGDSGLVMATAPLAGALFGFLRFNFNPASIFLGDSGALWVGFMLGCFGIIWSQKTATLVGITAPMMALSIPLLDTVLSIARRFLRRQPIFSADNGHIHHRLLARGLTPRRVVFLLYAATGLAACFSLLQSTARNGAEGIVVALFCFVVWMGIQYLGYQEFSIAAKLVRQGSFGSMVQSHICLAGCEQSLRSASSSDECWRALIVAGREFGFSHVALRMTGKRYQQQLDQTAGRHWSLHVPLSDLDYVQLTHRCDLPPAPMAVTALVDLLHRTLSAKAAEFARVAPSSVPASAQGQHSFRTEAISNG